LAVLITGLFVLTGLYIFKDSSAVILDKALIEESVIRRLAESVEGVCNCHRVRTRGLWGICTSTSCGRTRQRPELVDGGRMLSCIWNQKNTEIKRADGRKMTFENLISYAVRMLE
jgi:hypothetical protein